MSKRERHEAEEHENHERWLITYADMITLLMAFFIMMYSMSVVDLRKFAALSESARHVFGGKMAGVGRATRRTSAGLLTGGEALLNGIGALPANRAALVNEVKRELNASLSNRLRGEVDVTYSAGRVTISMKADAITFGAGKAELTDEVRQILDALGPSLRRARAPLLVEGHTCNLPIQTARYPSNWELSAQRAMNVMVYLIRHCGIDPDLISAVGYADTRPRASNASEEGRARNRRVDIVVLGNEGHIDTTADERPQRPTSENRAERLRLNPVRLVPPIDLRAIYYRHTGRRTVDTPAQH